MNLNPKHCYRCTVVVDAQIVKYTNAESEFFGNVKNKVYFITRKFSLGK